MKPEIFMTDEVCRDALAEFFDKSAVHGSDIHTVEVYQGNELKLKIAVPPYSCQYKPQIYSMSKSFTSTAIGLLVDDGVIALDDKITDIFSEKCSGEIDENMKKITLHHLLSMNTGHESCLLHRLKYSDDAVADFLKSQVKYEPGTHFMYNNAATYMLSNIVTKYTKMTVYDFLSQRVFRYLDIENTYWDTYESGLSQGAVGFHASVDDIAKLGLLYLNKGILNGKRILSEKWVNAATSVQSDNSGNGTPDWTSGYGYQFWRNARGGFRGDGACGQFCIVLPERNMVVAVQALVRDMQVEVDDVFDMAERIFGDSEISKKETEEKLKNLNTPEISEVPDEIFGRRYNADKNNLGVTALAFEKQGEAVALKFSDGKKVQKILCGNGCYCENRIEIKNLKPTLQALCETHKAETLHFAASYTYSKGELKINVRYLDNPHVDTINAVFDGKKVTLFSECDKSAFSAKENKLTGTEYDI